MTREFSRMSSHGHFGYVSYFDIWRCSDCRSLSNHRW
jgi:hypothetical protein